MISPVKIEPQQGFVLIIVVATLFIVSAIALLLNRESAMELANSGRELQSSQARYVAEAGISHASWQTDNNNCTASSTPLTANFGAHSYTVNVSSVGDSSILLSSTSTLPDGTHHTITRTSKASVSSTPTNVTRELGTDPGWDTFIDEGAQADNNYVTVAKMRVSNSNAGLQHALLYFDLSTIAPAATVTAATLELNLEEVASTDPGIVNVHSVTRAWTKNGATWNQYDGSNNWVTAGGDFDPAVKASTGVDAALPGPTQWDVTSLVAAWVADSTTNFGLLLAAELGTNGATFTTAEGATLSQRPKLMITYTCACGAVCTVTPAPASCDGTFRDEFNARVYTGSDGTLDWSTNPWLELGESDGPTKADIQIKSDFSNYQLQTKDNDNGGEGVEREVDLSGATTASLEYEYRRDKLDDSNDYTTVEISANGAAGPWIELARYQGGDGGTDPAYTLVTHDISSYISSNTRIRIKTSPDMDDKDVVWFDSVEIQCAP